MKKDVITVTTSSPFIGRSHSPATSTKVDHHPAKFTGESKSCHMHPCCPKCRDTHKVKSYDVVSNCRLITWRLVDGRPGLHFSGFSATGMLAHLDHHFVDDRDVFDDEK